MQVVIEHVNGKIHIAVAFITPRVSVVGLVHMMTENAAFAPVVPADVGVMIEEDVAPVTIAVEQHNDRIAVVRVRITHVGRHGESRRITLPTRRFCYFDTVRVAGGVSLR